MCDSGTNDKNVRVFTVRRADYPGNSCTYRDGATLVDAEFDGAEVGDTISVTLSEMTEDQLNNLPDFAGW